MEVLICPAGYVLRPHPTQTGISVCTCSEEIADLLLCEDDQETIVIRVRREREKGKEEKEGGTERKSEGGWRGSE